MPLGLQIVRPEVMRRAEVPVLRVAMNLTQELPTRSEHGGAAIARPCHEPIPGPNGARLGLGHLARLEADFLGYTTELARRYGDCVHYRVGLVPVYQFTNPEQIQEILVTKAKSFRKTDRLKRVLGRALGNSLLLDEGESWANQRARLQPAFHPQRLLGYADPIVRQAEELIDRNVDREFDISRELSRLTLLTTAEALFRADLSDVTERFVEEVAALQELAYPDFTAHSIVPLGSLKANAPRMSQAIEFLADVITKIIDDGKNPVGRANMSREQARDEAMILLAGGTGTTATAITWAAYLLARNTDVQERVVDEVDRVTGGRRPTGEDARQLEFTEMVLNEAMRLYPPAYTTSRQSIEPVEVGGHRLTAGSQVHLVPYITHRDARWFEDPLRFRPDRFSAVARSSIPRFAFIPFGAGPRACIGGGLAMMTGTLVLATLLRRCRLELADGQGEPELEPHISLHPKGGIRLRLTQRSGPSL